MCGQLRSSSTFWTLLVRPTSLLLFGFVLLILGPLNKPTNRFHSKHTWLCAVRICFMISLSSWSLSCTSGPCFLMKSISSFRRRFSTSVLVSLSLTCGSWSLLIFSCHVSSAMSVLQDSRSECANIRKIDAKSQGWSRREILFVIKLF